MNRVSIKIVGIISIMILFAISCKHSDISTGTNPSTPVDDATQVTASVSGIVLDESNVPVAGAVVTSGIASTVTNSLGMFSFNNILLSKNNGSVTVTKTGYFKGIRSFKAIAGKDHVVKIQLMQRSLSGTVNSTGGGNVNLNGGALMTFPVNAFVKSNGTAYTGTVNVYGRWIDPAASNLPAVIPGELRGINKDGTESILETYGMLGAELEDNSGNILKIAPGKKVSISVPIPSAISATAPQTIPLWHFNDTTARWNEEGTGTRSGNTYTAEVNKFSFWNWDASAYPVRLDATFIDGSTGKPLVAAGIKVRLLSNSNSYGYGITNGTGFASITVPRNNPLALDVLDGCGNAIYTKNIGTITDNTDLGIINIPLTSTQVIIFSGNIVNCSGTGVADGNLAFYSPGNGGTSAYVRTNSAGAFSFTVLKNCNGSSLNYSYQGTDNVTLEKSPVLTGSVVSGSVSLGTIIACNSISAIGDVYLGGYSENIAQNRFAQTWKNGVLTTLTNGVRKTLVSSVFVSGTDLYAAGYENSATFAGTIKLWKNGVATDLTNGTTAVNTGSVYVSGSDVYVAGSERVLSSPYSTAKLWKNGVAINLTGGSTNADARSVFVAGNDVYVAGYEYNATGYSVAKIWKNGIGTDLTGGTSTGVASSVFVSGTNVFVCGYEQNPYRILKVWKNGTATSFTNPDIYNVAEANSIYVTGNDVYVAGCEQPQTSGYTIARVWKNNIGTDLTSGVYSAGANAVYAVGTNVFVGGWEKNATYGVKVAKLWQNGLPTSLSDGKGDAEIKSVFIK